LRYRVPVWTAKADALLRKHYDDRGAAWCADRLGQAVTATINRMYKLRHRPFPEKSGAKAVPRR